MCSAIKYLATSSPFERIENKFVLGDEDGRPKAKSGYFKSVRRKAEIFV
jgi:hypothetical protein